MTNILKNEYARKSLFVCRRKIATFEIAVEFTYLNT